MAAEALEQSMLESKDKEQLLAIAQALGIKTTSRAAKATLIDKILETTGGGSPLAAGTSASTNGRAKAAKEAAPEPAPEATIETDGAAVAAVAAEPGETPQGAATGRSRGRSWPRRRAVGRLGDRAHQVRRGRGHRSRGVAGSLGAEHLFALGARCRW